MMETGLQKFDAYVERISTLLANTSRLVVTNQETCKGAEGKLSDINSLLKDIESERKQLKAPFMDACKKIDERAKELSEGLSGRMLEIKSILSAYNDKLQKELEEKRRMDEEAARKERLLDEHSLSMLDQLKSRLVLIGSEVNVSKLIELSSKISAYQPTREEYRIYFDSAVSVKEMLLTACSERMKVLKSPEYLSEYQKKQDEARLESERIEKEALEKKTADEEKEKKRIESEQKKNAPATRKVLIWKIADISKVPGVYFKLDEQLVGEKVKEGVSIPGIISYYETIIVSK